MLVLKPNRYDRNLRYPKEAWTHKNLVSHIEGSRHDLRGCYNHNPAGGLRSKRQGWWMRVLGAKPGLPDLMFYKPMVWDRVQYVGLALEIKREGYSKLSNCQKHWCGVLESHGWFYIRAHGLTCSIAAVERAYPEGAPDVMLLGSLAERKAYAREILLNPDHGDLSLRDVADYTGLSLGCVHGIQRRVNSVQGEQAPAA